jgi:hypothetical protein
MQAFTSPSPSTAVAGLRFSPAAVTLAISSAVSPSPEVTKGCSETPKVGMAAKM